MIVRIMVEGTSDVPTVREVFVRGFGQVQGSDFQVIWHRGKGRLPSDPSSAPSPRELSLLGLLPAKLRAFGRSNPNDPVVILVDADRDDWRALRNDLTTMLAAVNPRPASVLFRIAVEEIESWFVADIPAVKRAYPSVNEAALAAIVPDSVVGAWEALATALGLIPTNCTGADKEEWAKMISPHLTLNHPPSPTLDAFIRGIERVIGLTI